MANEDVTAYTQPAGGAEVAFTIRSGEWVTAETGFVVTTKMGVTKVLKPVTLGYPHEGDDPNPKPVLNLEPGELLYTLHYLGEGYDVFWYKGRLYSDQISSPEPDPDPPPPSRILQVLSRPDEAWWIKVRSEGDQIGWIVDPPYFANSDRCA